MQICVVEYTQNKSHVAVERSIRTVAAKTNDINGLQGFAKNQNMPNSAFRYKLDTNGKI